MRNWQAQPRGGATYCETGELCNSIILVVHVCKQWPMKRHVSPWKTAQTNTPVSVFWKASWDLANLIFQPVISDEVWQYLTYIILYAEWPLLVCRRGLKVRHCRIGTIRSCFPLRVGNTCGTYDLQSYVMICLSILCKTSLDLTRCMPWQVNLTLTLLWLIQQWSPIVFFCHLRRHAI